ncbi:cupredoxin domain-containing protein [Roseivivax sp. CAU 1761]
MRRATRLVLGMSLAAWTAGPALAEVHEVLMLGTGYFPGTVYPVAGDTVRFVNKHAVPMAATAIDGTWSTGPLATGEAAEIAVTPLLSGAYDNRILPLDLTLLTTLGGVVPSVVASGVIDHTQPAPTLLDTQ